jgi:hypothetical protein
MFKRPSPTLVSFALPRWGVGHSTGLLLVGGVFIFKDYLHSRDNSSDEGNDPVEIPHSVGHFFESLVGLFMLALGLYGLRTAFRKQRERLEGILLDSTEDEEWETELPILTETLKEEKGEADSDESLYRDDDFPDRDDHSATQTPTFHDNILESDQIALEVDAYHHSRLSTIGEVAGETAHTHRIVCCTRCFSTKTLALFVGIVHGLAGPGGVLGIVPAVQLHDWKLASCYLGSFCISSTMTMGLFACTFGTVSSFLGNKKNWEFQIQCISSVLSLAVGVTWLVLLSLGKLDDVFP